jgi:WD40 repeat protein/serine/threonine protein kinase
MSPCVDDELLRRLLAEQLDPAEQQAADAHVDRCIRCQDRLSRLLDETDEGCTNGYRDLLRRAGSPSPTEPGEGFLRRLQDIDLSEEATAPAEGESPAPSAIHFPDPPTKRGPLGRLESYHIVAELGCGAYGLVFKAYDERLDCLVAMKVLKPELAANGRDRARFEEEARKAATVRNAHVVTIHHVGSTPGFALPYFVMEYIDGEALSDRLRRQGAMKPKEAAEIVRQVAVGLAAAHGRGLVHRDIKPANIVLQAVVRSPPSVAEGTKSSSVGDGLRTTDYGLLAKITDFGLARAVETRTPNLTQSGGIVGTPSYMSPEQIMTPRQIDGRSDVYSLGAVLYEMLTGEAPFRGRTHLILHQVIHEEPRPPRRLNDTVPCDLETICLKALAKEPARRYQTMQELVDDLQRWQNGEPVHARPIGSWEQAVKWARRRPVIAALLASIVVVSSAGFSGIIWQWRQADLARRDVVYKAEELQIKNYFRNIALAERELASNSASRAEELLEECPEHLRGWEWHYLKRLGHGSPSPLQHTGPVICVAYSPDGRTITVGCQDGTVKVWDVLTRKELRTLETPARVRSVNYSSDGRCLATGNSDGVVRLWNAATGQLLYSLPGHCGNVTRVIFSHDSRQLAFAGQNKTLILWDVVTGQEIRTFSSHSDEVWPVGFSGDGQRLISACRDGMIKIWDTATGRESFAFQGQTEVLTSAALSSDDRHLALGDLGGTVRIWGLRNGQEVLTLPGHVSRVYGLVFSGDGHRLISAGYDKTIRVWDTATGQEALTLRGHASVVSGVALSSDGLRLVSASFDGTVRIWDATPMSADREDAQVITLRGHAHVANFLAFSPDGRRLASASWDGTVKVWDWTAGQEILTFGAHRGQVHGVAFSPDGRQLASARLDDPLQLWDAATGRVVRTFPTDAGNFLGVIFSPDGRRLFSCHNTGAVRAWDATTGNLLCTVPAHRSPVLRFTLSRDGQYLASSGGTDRTVKVWDTKSWELVRTLEGHKDVIWGVAFSSDCGRLASASDDGTVILWDLQSTESPHVLRGHADRVYGVAFSPDGLYLASASWDQTVRIWDAKTCREVCAPLRGHAGHVWGVAFSPNGQHLASCGGYLGKGEIKVWNASLWENGQLGKR